MQALLQQSALKWWLAPVAAALLTACGGGSSDSAASGSGSAVTTASISGIAVDGYLQGATVFLDLNRDGQPNGAEPQTATGARGQFTLELGNLSESAVQGTPIVALGGVDADTGFNYGGRLVTLAGGSGANTVLTPFSSVMTALVQSGAAADMAAAGQLVAKALGLTDSALLHLDPVSTWDTHPDFYAKQLGLERAIQGLALTSGDAASAQATQQAWNTLASRIQAAADAGTPLEYAGDLLADSATLPTFLGARESRDREVYGSSYKEQTRVLSKSLEYASKVALKTSDRSARKVRLQAVTQAFDLLKAQLKANATLTLPALAAPLDQEWSSGGAFVNLVNGSASRSSSTVEQAIQALVNVFSGHNSGGDGTAPTPVTPPPVNTTGRLLASNCFQCHGTNGSGGFENIRGGEAAEVKEYLRKSANSDIMAAHAQGYTDAQLNAIIAYLQQ